MSSLAEQADSELGLDGRVALITGGTRGLGRAIAARLCRAGCDVLITYAHSPSDAQATVDALDGAKGTIGVMRSDAISAADRERLAADIRERHGGLDILVHSVASWQPMPALRPDTTALHRDLGTALDLPLHGAGGPVPLLRRGGRFIAVSSSGAGRTVPAYLSLGVAKAALEAAVRYLAVELAPHEITANAVSTAKLDKGPGTPNPEMARVLATRTPAGRLTTPEDVAGVVALLCAREASWIQGQVITVDGGLSLRG
jgi:enoyl-[acyl-carrier protein] reductase III